MKVQEDSSQLDKKHLQLKQKKLKVSSLQKLIHQLVKKTMFHWIPEEVQQQIPNH